MGSPSASLRPTPPCATNERGLAPQREQRPESDLPSADAETCMLVGLRRSLARRIPGIHGQQPSAGGLAGEGRQLLIPPVELLESPKGSPNPSTACRFQVPAWLE